MECPRGLPYRGNVHLDNCLTNRPDLFNTCYPFIMSVKTDHTCFVVPGATKLKPIRTGLQSSSESRSLRTDENYAEPAAVVIDSDREIPEISERKVWISLRALKKNCDRADMILYWVLKEHAEILMPVITKVWNLSISTHF